MSSQPTYEYRSAARLATFATVLLVFSAVISAIAAFSTAAQFPVLDEVRAGHAVAPEVAEAHDSRQRLIAALQLSVDLAAGIVYLFCVYCASRNAHALGADKMQYGPGQSVGCFFIPLINLVMPYFMLRELWKASSPVARGPWQQAPVSPILGAWWALDVVRGFCHYGPFWVMLDKKNMADFVADRFGNTFVNWLSEDVWGLLASNVLSVATCVLTVVVLVSIQRLQEQKRLMMMEQETPELELSV